MKPTPYSVPISEFANRYGIEPRECPFCHGYDLWVHVGPNPHVECGTCGAEGPRLRQNIDWPTDPIPDALLRWNARDKPEMIRYETKPRRT